ncbi:hypothetical protein [Sphingobacterium sp.]|uniref:hypothetical protein n=1 Tax=Sphingobacterium sp. TaxID=341027 RepID=UPI0031DE83B4
MKFKGTKGQHKKVYQGDICIGIGVETSPNYFEMTAHSILPDCEDMSDKEVDKCMRTLEADMTLYSKAPAMLEMLKHVLALAQCGNIVDAYKIEELIESATKI